MLQKSGKPESPHTEPMPIGGSVPDPLPDPFRAACKFSFALCSGFGCARLYSGPSHCSVKLFFPFPFWFSSGSAPFWFHCLSGLAESLLRDRYPKLKAASVSLQTKLLPVVIVPLKCSVLECSGSCGHASFRKRLSSITGLMTEQQSPIALVLSCRCVGQPCHQQETACHRFVCVFVLCW